MIQLKALQEREKRRHTKNHFGLDLPFRHKLNNIVRQLEDTLKLNEIEYNKDAIYLKKEVMGIIEWNRVDYYHPLSKQFDDSLRGAAISTIAELYSKLTGKKITYIK